MNAMLRRLYALWKARNLEFVRDRRSMAWSFLFPIGLIIAFLVIFSGPERPMFKIGILAPPGTTLVAAKAARLHPFLDTRFVDFYVPDSAEAAVHKLERHQVDLLLDLRTAGAPPHYWVNTDAPKGYLAEKMLVAADATAVRNVVTGAAVRYVDWVLPGILGMNLMFSSVFGVGYAIIRYRKNGFLRQLRTTPLTAFEFLTAQVLSRLLLVMAIATLTFVPLSLLLHLRVEGSTLLLFLLASLASLSMISMGLVVAAYVTSEELAGGLLNFVTWPMMLLSGVWFSLEGASPWLQFTANLLPLTHLLDGARAIMLDGAGIAELWPHLVTLAVMSLVFLGIGAIGFKWRSD